jgi:hypothetical protein
MTAGRALSDGSVIAVDFFDYSDDRFTRPLYAWAVKLPDDRCFEGTDLGGPALGPMPTEEHMLGTLCGLLTAAAESYAYRMRTGQDGENEDLFPAPVVEWAYSVSDELTMLAEELENHAA